MIDQKKRSQDLIPANAIYISEAFTIIFDAIKETPQILATLPDWIQQDLMEVRQMGENLNPLKGRPRTPEDLIIIHRLKEVVVFFRWHLSLGEPTACIRDPIDGTVLRLDYANWNAVPPGMSMGELPFGFDDEFLGNGWGDGNPDTFIRGALRPVFLFRKEFEQWLAKTFSNSKHGGGRPSGTGLQTADAVIWEKMHELIRANKANSANEAARQLAQEASGGGTLRSKQDRLRKGYLQHYPLD